MNYNIGDLIKDTEYSFKYGLYTNRREIMFYYLYWNYLGRINELNLNNIIIYTDIFREL
jgi:hypothetical protein